MCRPNHLCRGSGRPGPEPDAAPGLAPSRAGKGERWFRDDPLTLNHPAPTRWMSTRGTCAPAELYTSSSRAIATPSHEWKNWVAGQSSMHAATSRGNLWGSRLRYEREAGEVTGSSLLQVAKRSLLYYMHRRRRGSSVSRRPSPSRLTANTVMARNVPGNRMIQIAI
jgi:hypothetical protein